MDFYDPRLRSHILDFFNSVQDPEEIVRRIKDDPGYGSAQGYGIRMSLARRILAVRDQLPGGKFTSVAQIDRISGVGPDTCHDIAFTFAQAVPTPEPTPDPPLIPSYVITLERYYGGPGPMKGPADTAVFFQILSPGTDLETFARQSCRHFVDPLWDNLGEGVFAEWCEEWRRQSTSEKSIIEALRLHVPEQAEQLLDNLVGGDEAAQAAVTSAFDHPSVIDLRVYYLGDEDIWTGVLIAGMRENHEATVLVLLND